MVMQVCVGVHSPQWWCSGLGEEWPRVLAWLGSKAWIIGHRMLPARRAADQGMDLQPIHCTALSVFILCDYTSGICPHITSHQIRFYPDSHNHHLYCTVEFLGCHRSALWENLKGRLEFKYNYRFVIIESATVSWIQDLVFGFLGLLGLGNDGTLPVLSRKLSY